MTLLRDCTLKIGSGATPRGGDSVYVSDGVALIRSQNIYNGLFVGDGLAFITDEQATKMRGVTVEEGDVLLNITGDSVARCTTAPGSVLPARVNQHVAIIRPDQSKLLSRYLMYYLVSPPVQAMMLSLAGSGGTRNALTKRMIEKFDVPTPPVSEQEKILALLSTYDDLIDNNRRRIALLEQSARLLYREWFVHLRFPGHEHVKVVDGVPEGWQLRKLEDFSEEIRVAVKPEEIPSGTPYIGLEHMPRRSITLGDWGRSDDVASQKFTYEIGDILFGRIRPYFHKVGFTLSDGITSSDAIVMRATEKRIYCFLLLLVSSDQFVALASQTVKEGSKMPRADWKYMQKQTFLFPPDWVFDELNDLCKPIIDELGLLAHMNVKLREARDLLLPRLMRGEIEI